MAFDRQPSITAERIGEITIMLYDPDPQHDPGAGLPPLPQRATATIEVVLSDGTRKTVPANVAEHFSAQVINQLRTFVASVRTKAENEILPD